MYVQTSGHITVLLSWNHISYLACKLKLSTVLITIFPHSCDINRLLSQSSEAWMHSFNVCYFYNHYSFAELICVSLCHIPKFGLFFSCYALGPDSFIPILLYPYLSVHILAVFAETCFISAESKGSNVLVIRHYIYSWY